MEINNIKEVEITYEEIEKKFNIDIEELRNIDDNEGIITFKLKVEDPKE